MRVAYKTDVGKKRKNNEDTLYIDKDKYLFLLADGTGGHQGGEVASKIAVDEAADHILQSINNLQSDKNIAKLLVEALFRAHDAIKENAENDLNLIGMNTTLLQIVVKNHKAYICHVGDSRAYLLNEGIYQLTKDQTVADYLVEHNIMSKEEIPPQRWHTLTQTVGWGEDIIPAHLNIDINQGDCLLLCTDGLTDMLADEEIKEIIQMNGKDIDKATDDLVKMANKKGGKDNISVILVEYEEEN